MGRQCSQPCQHLCQWEDFGSKHLETISFIYSSPRKLQIFNIRKMTLILWILSMAESIHPKVQVRCTSSRGGANNCRRHAKDVHKSWDFTASLRSCHANNFNSISVCVSCQLYVHKISSKNCTSNSFHSLRKSSSYSGVTCSVNIMHLFRCVSIPLEFVKLFGRGEGIINYCNLGNGPFKMLNAGLVLSLNLCQGPSKGNIRLGNLPRNHSGTEGGSNLINMVDKRWRGP